MRLSFTVFGLPPQDYAPLARRAEALGFDAVWFADHLITPLEWSTPYPYNASGNPGYTPETPLSDVWAVIGNIAAQTRRLSLGTGVVIVPLRNPFVIARAAATAQNLSGGRLLMGVGSGWMPEEYLAAGQPWANRGRRLAEALDVFELLWSGRPVEHHGRFFDFPPVQFGGEPRAPIPIIFGGSTEAALARAATRGDGWYGPTCSLDDSQKYREAMERHRVDAERSDRPFRYFVRLTDPDAPPGPPTPEALRRYAGAGFEDVVVAAWRSGPSGARTLDERLADMERVAESAQAAGVGMDVFGRPAAPSGEATFRA